MKRAALLLFLVAGCSSGEFAVAPIDSLDSGSAADDTGSATVDTSVTDSSTDDDTSSADDSGGDASTLDGSIVDGGIVDGSIVDGSIVDSAKADSAKADSGTLSDSAVIDGGSPQDTAVVDSASPPDTAGPDTTGSDTAGPDTAGADARDGAACLQQTPAQVPLLSDKTCEQLATMYADALAKAKACGCSEDCAVTACDNFCCTCPVFVNPKSETYAWLDKLKAAASNKLCIGICPAIVCPTPKNSGCMAIGTTTMSCVTTR